MNFTDHISFILEDSPSKCSQNLDDAYEIIRDIDRANQHIIMLQNKLRILKRKINGELAIQVRKHHPALNISVNPKQCKIGYKSKYLSFYPDIEKGIWQINGEDPKFINRFKKLYRRYTIISPEITNLVASISDFFTNHYKSLGENIIGEGAIIIEGRSGNLRQLSEYSNRIDQLNTRLSRQLIK